MIYDEIYKTVDEYIHSGKEHELVSFLENLSESAPDYPGELSALLGLVLLMPPFADYDASLKNFKRAYGTAWEASAAVWYCYLYVTLYPVDDTFVEHLNLDSAEGLYVMALYRSHRGEPDWLDYLHKSIDKQKFPNNLRIYLRQKHNVKDFAKLSEEAKQLVRERNIEQSPPAKDCHGLVSSYWDELILGRSLTSDNWNALLEELK